MMRTRDQFVGMMMTSTVSVVVVAQLEAVEVWKGRRTGDDKAEPTPRRADGLSVGIQTKEHWHITDRCDTSRKVNHLRCDKYLVFVRSHLGHCSLIRRNRGSAGRRGTSGRWLGRCARYLEATVRRSGIWQVVAWPTGCNCKLNVVGPAISFKGKKQQTAVAIANYDSSSDYRSRSRRRDPE